MSTLATIGYEGASLDDFLDTLSRAGIRQVIDIRDVPASRRPGFSKNVLASALHGEGISYLHLKPLGDPKPGREAARQGRFDAFRAIYLEHLASPPAQAALQQAVAAAEGTPSVLLCYERDAKHCHRTLVAKAMNVLKTFQIRDLGVQKRPNRAATGMRGSSKDGAIAIASA